LKNLESSISLSGALLDAWLELARVARFPYELAAFLPNICERPEPVECCSPLTLSLPCFCVPCFCSCYLFCFRLARVLMVQVFRNSTHLSSM
jgi:hypothetical protein